MVKIGNLIVVLLATDSLIAEHVMFEMLIVIGAKMQTMELVDVKKLETITLVAITQRVAHVRYMEVVQNAPVIWDVLGAQVMEFALLIMELAKMDLFTTLQQLVHAQPIEIVPLVNPMVDVIGVQVDNVTFKGLVLDQKSQLVWDIATTSPLLAVDVSPQKVALGVV